MTDVPLTPEGSAEPVSDTSVADSPDVTHRGDTEQGSADVTVQNLTDEHRRLAALDVASRVSHDTIYDYLTAAQQVETYLIDGTLPQQSPPA